jgi:hypothetical protein
MPAASVAATANNFLTSLNTIAQGSPSAPVAAGTPLAASTNAAAAPGDTVFGASGWKGSSLSSPSSSLGLSDQAIARLADDLSGDSAENDNDSSSDDASGTDGDTGGVQLFTLEGSTAAFREGQAGDGGDAGGGE